MSLENVMIDSVNYRIEKTDEPIIVDGRTCAADVDYNLALIRIKDDVYQSGRAAHTIMHEIVHALLAERGFDDDFATETMVDELAAGIINLIRANPQLINFITENRFIPETNDNGRISVCECSNDTDRGRVTPIQGIRMGL